MVTAVRRSRPRRSGAPGRPSSLGAAGSTLQGGARLHKETCRGGIRNLLDVCSFVGLLSLLLVFVVVCPGSRPAWELEELVTSGAGSTWQQTLPAGAGAVQVTVEDFVGSLRGLLGGACGPAPVTARPLHSGRDATRARKATWLEWALSPSGGRNHLTRRERDEAFAYDAAHFVDSDRNGDGAVSLVELKRSFKHWSLPVGVAGSSFRAANVDGDGSLSFGEYLVAWESLSDWQPEGGTSG